MAVKFSEFATGTIDADLELVGFDSATPENVQVSYGDIKNDILSSFVGSNIYNSNGTLTGNRIVTLGGFNLSLVGSSFTNRFTSAGRLLLGTTTESTFILDAVGDARVSNILNAAFGLFGGATYNANFGLQCSSRFRLQNNLESTSTCGFAGTGTIGNFGLGANGNNGIFANVTAYSWVLPLTTNRPCGFASILSFVPQNLGGAAKTALFEFSINADSTGVQTRINNIVSNPNFGFFQINAGYVTTATSSGEIIGVVRNVGTIDDANSRVFTYIGNDIKPIYNTGLSNATMRGYYYNPTLNVTPLVHIALENTTGNVLLGTTSGSVGIGANTSINASSILHITSTTKGFLPPRMTGTQAEAIATPAEGLMVYSTDGSGTTITSKGWWGYDGAAWAKLN